MRMRQKFRMINDSASGEGRECFFFLNFFFFKLNNGMSWTKRSVFFSYQLQQRKLSFLVNIFHLIHSFFFILPNSFSARPHFQRKSFFFFFCYNSVFFMGGWDYFSLKKIFLFFSMQEYCLYEDVNGDGLNL